MVRLSKAALQWDFKLIKHKNVNCLMLVGKCLTTINYLFKDCLFTKSAMWLHYILCLENGVYLISIPGHHSFINEFDLVPQPWMCGHLQKLLRMWFLLI